MSKYARGGSVRSQSARRMYIAVDALLGHFASNGRVCSQTRKNNCGVAGCVGGVAGLLGGGGMVAKQCALLVCAKQHDGVLLWRLWGL